MRPQQPGLLDISASVHLQPRTAKAAPSLQHDLQKQRPARASAVTPQLLSTLGFSTGEALEVDTENRALALRDDASRVKILPSGRQLHALAPARKAKRSRTFAVWIPLEGIRHFWRHPAARHAAISRVQRKLRALPAIILRKPQFDAPIHFTGAPLTTVLPPQTSGTRQFVAAYEASRAARIQAVESAKAVRSLVKIRDQDAPVARTFRAPLVIPVPAVSFEKRVARVDLHPFMRAFYGVAGAAVALFVAVAGVYGYQQLEESNARGSAATQRAESAAKRANEAAARIAFLEQQSIKMHRSLQSLEAQDARLRGIIARAVAAPTAAPQVLAQIPRPVREPSDPRVDALPRASAPDTAGKLAYIPSIDPSGGGLVTSSYGWRTSPWPEFHRGLDLAQPMGHAVRAAADGVVEEAGWNGGFGKLIDVDHGNGYHTYYGHLSRIDVTVGQHIKRGEIIAGVGMTGQATGPHLHYQVMLRGSPIDPTPYMHGIPPSAIAAVR